MKFKSFNDDTRAGSMIIMIIAVTVLAFGLMFALLSWAYNPVIESFNGFVDSGQVTEETARMFNLALFMWRASPFFALIGLVLFSFERNKGTDLTAQTYLSYLFLMLVGLFSSVYLVFTFGLSLDGITQGLEGTILTDVSAEWDSSGPRGAVSKIIYYLCLLPGFTTSILFMIHPILKQRETRELFGGESQQDEVFSNGREVVLEQV